MKNKIHTLSYFKKRLKDNGYVIWDLMNAYSTEDPRKWTIMLNPGAESLFITCLVNRQELNDTPEFELYDGGLRFQKNLTVKTSSMEVLINMFTHKGILPETELYVKKT